MTGFSAHAPVANVTFTLARGMYRQVVNEPTAEEFWASLETVKIYEPGTVLFQEGEEPTGVFVVHEGLIDLSFASRTGSPKRLRVAEVGQILGLSALVGESVHDCTASTHTPCSIGFVDRRTFLDALDQSPSTWFSVLRLLSSDVNAVYDDMRSLALR